MSKPQEKGKLVVVSGPSGVGKSTICREVVKRLDDVFLSVSVTTRDKTPSEVDGQDYWFVSEEEFKKLREQGKLLEWAKVFDNYYGTPKDKVDQAIREGKSILLEIDVQGGQKVKVLYPDAIMIFILAPSQTDLAERLKNRGRDDETTTDLRLEKAETEIAAAWEYYDNMVINEELEQAVNEVIGIIKGSETGDKK